MWPHLERLGRCLPLRRTWVSLSLLLPSCFAGLDVLIAVHRQRHKQFCTLAYARIYQEQIATVAENHKTSDHGSHTRACLSFAPRDDLLQEVRTSMLGDTTPCILHRNMDHVLYQSCGDDH